ncbi:MAG: hypothetical protein J0I36_10915, partial [Pandoraea sp.]|nr:hypothetical protein [Pandoraea sp.]
MRADVPVYKLIVATSIGNALEWYDLIVYGYFAVTISKLFFPAHDATVSLLMARLPTSFLPDEDQG